MRILLQIKTMATSYLICLADLLLSYPEVVLAIACFSFAHLYNQMTRKSVVPINWPFVGMLPNLLANLDHVNEHNTALLRETGCSFRFRGPWLLGMESLLTCDPAIVNHVFNVNFANYPKGEEFLEIFDIFGEGIFNADGESWKSQRKRAHGVMSSPNFRAFVAECSRDKVENALVPLLSKLVKQGEVVDLQDVFLRLTFDMTCNLVFGVDPGRLSEGFPTVPFARAMDDAMEVLFFRHVTPPLVWKLMRRLRIGKEKKMSEAWGVIDDFVAQNIAKKKEERIYKEDLLTSYLEDGKQGEEKPMDNKLLRDTAVNLMLAGRDTTGVALSWFFWLLAENPQVKSKILEELSEHTCEKAYPDSHTVFSSDVLAKLVYLHAALLECLRLYPPVPFEHKRAVKPEALPNGMEANPKVRIMFAMHAMGRMEGIWGKDCLEFRPERWISKGGRLKHQPSYKFLSFNCGPRTCLGKEIAFTQMKTVVAAMISNFDVEVVEGHVVEPKLSIILHMRNGLKVRVKEKRQFTEMVINNGR